MLTTSCGPLGGRWVVCGDGEFVQAAVAAGAGPGWVLRRHVLPHAAPTLIGFVPVVMALALLTEAALSAMSIGVQAPAASWGTLIADGQALFIALRLGVNSLLSYVVLVVAGVVAGLACVLASLLLVNGAAAFRVRRGAPAAVAR